MGDHCLLRGSFRDYLYYSGHPQNTWTTLKMNSRDTLNLIAFLFTILMVLYGLSKGFDDIELFLNLIYFTVLVLSQLENLKEALF